MNHIKMHAPSVDDTILEAFCRQSTATVHEAMGRRGAMMPSIKPIARGMRLCGRALTVQCHTGDNIMLVKAVSMARKGDVIVADMGNVTDSGCFGEVLAVECVTKGVAGIIISSSVRDSRELIKMGFPVFSSGLCILGTAKGTLGTINHPITVAGVIVDPGDLVLGDDDGVVVVKAKEARGVLSLSNERTEKENVVMARLRAGESLFDIYSYQQIFDKLGCKTE